MKNILLDIQRVTCRHYGVTVDAIHLGARPANIVRARHMAMLMLREYSSKPLSVIAELFDMSEPGALYAYKRAANFAELAEVKRKVEAELDKTAAKISASVAADS